MKYGKSFLANLVYRCWQCMKYCFTNYEPKPFISTSEHDNQNSSPKHHHYRFFYPHFNERSSTNVSIPRTLISAIEWNLTNIPEAIHMLASNQLSYSSSLFYQKCPFDESLSFSLAACLQQFYTNFCHRLHHHHQPYQPFPINFSMIASKSWISLQNHQISFFFFFFHYFCSNTVQCLPNHPTMKRNVVPIFNRNYRLRQERDTLSRKERNIMPVARFDISICPPKTSLVFRLFSASTDTIYSTAILLFWESFLNSCSPIIVVVKQKY